MANKYKNALVVLAMICSFPLARAEPTPTVSRLMREPATIWDLGIFKLENRLNDSRYGACQ